MNSCTKQEVPVADMLLHTAALLVESRHRCCPFENNAAACWDEVDIAVGLAAAAWKR